MVRFPAFLLARDGTFWASLCTWNCFQAPRSFPSADSSPISPSTRPNDGVGRLQFNCYNWGNESRIEPPFRSFSCDDRQFSQRWTFYRRQDNRWATSWDSSSASNEFAIGTILGWLLFSNLHIYPNFVHKVSYVRTKWVSKISELTDLKIESLGRNSQYPINEAVPYRESTREKSLELKC